MSDDKAKLAAYVEKLLANWPELDDETLNRIAGLLVAGGRHARAMRA
jgi:hypothetical protein